jgi:hypothetical protein
MPADEGSPLIRRLLFVAFFLEVGLLLTALPWSTFWERNYFAYALPALRPLLSNNFVRGAVSGLGFVNLLAAFAELAPLFTARERRKPGQHEPDHVGGYQRPDTQVEP